MLLGRVIKSNSHVDYAVRILAPGDASDPPSPEDCAFGSFVEIAVEGSHDSLIGVIYDTLLLNPAYGTLGPHLSSEPQLSAFAPDYLPETSTVLGVAVIGCRRGSGTKVTYQQGVPPVAARVGAETRKLANDHFIAFHNADGLAPDLDPSVTPGIARVAYLPRLAAMANPAIPELLNGILTRLIAAFPDSAATLSVLRSNLEWDTRLGRR